MRVGSGIEECIRGPTHDEKLMSARLPKKTAAQNSCSFEGKTRSVSISIWPTIQHSSRPECQAG